MTTSPLPVGEGLGVRVGALPLPHGFPDIPGIDRASVARTLGDHRACFLRLLEGFITEFTDAVAQTRHDLAQGERAAAARRIHTLRGNAGNLGALELMRTAGRLEEAILRGETDLEAGLESLGRQLAALTAASAPWRGEVADPAPPVLSKPPPLDSDQLHGLREALHGYNLSALRRFDNLEPALRGVLGVDHTGALGRAIHDLRFEEALDILASQALD